MHVDEPAGAPAAHRRPWPDLGRTDPDRVRARWIRRPPRRVGGKHGRAFPGRPTRRACWPDFAYPRIRGGRRTDNAQLLPPATLMILDRGSPAKVAADPRSSMGSHLVTGPGDYSGCCCHITRSNSLPSGSANVVWRTAATPGGSAAGGSLISLSGLAPRPVSRSISSS